LLAHQRDEVGEYFCRLFCSPDGEKIDREKV